jgi:hypothetical protein
MAEDLKIGDVVREITPDSLESTSEADTTKEEK